MGAPQRINLYCNSVGSAAEGTGESSTCFSQLGAKWCKEVRDLPGGGGVGMIRLELKWRIRAEQVKPVVPVTCTLSFTVLAVLLGTS